MARSAAARAAAAAACELERVGRVAALEAAAWRRPWRRAAVAVAGGLRRLDADELRALAASSPDCSPAAWFRAARADPAALAHAEAARAAAAREAAALRGEFEAAMARGGVDSGPLLWLGLRTSRGVWDES